MRRPFAVFLLVAATRVFAQDANTPDVLIARAIQSFHEGRAAAAVGDLESSLGTLLAVETARTYVREGRLDNLTTVETALAYLALSHFRLGNEDEARDTLLRLVAAERITPTYATLPLGADGVELETLAAALIPLETLAHPAPLPAEDARAPLAAMVPKHEVATIPERQEVMSAVLGDFVRVAAEAAVPQPAKVPPQIRAGTKPVTVEQPVNVPQISADQSPCPGERPPAASVTKLVAPAPAPPAREPAQASAGIAAADADADSSNPRKSYAALRDADAASQSGAVTHAIALYTDAIAPRDASRELLIAAGTGLYRAGAFREAAGAFGRTGTFARGEEDLRYYYAVSLYESGEYEAAQREMNCALPFIVETDEVLRYRTKIELTLASK